MFKNNIFYNLNIYYFTIKIKLFDKSVKIQSVNMHLTFKLQ